MPSKAAKIAIITTGALVTAGVLGGVAYAATRGEAAEDDTPRPPPKPDNGRAKPKPVPVPDDGEKQKGLAPVPDERTEPTPTPSDVYGTLPKPPSSRGEEVVTAARVLLSLRPDLAGKEQSASDYLDKLADAAFFTRFAGALPPGPRKKLSLGDPSHKPWREAWARMRADLARMMAIGKPKKHYPSSPQRQAYFAMWRLIMAAVGPVRTDLDTAWVDAYRYFTQNLASVSEAIKAGNLTFAAAMAEIAIRQRSKKAKALPLPMPWKGWHTVANYMQRMPQVFP
jgi:hypothetical protein